MQWTYTAQQTEKGNGPGLTGEVRRPSTTHHSMQYSDL